MRWTPGNEFQPELHPRSLCIEAAINICAILASYQGYLTSFPCDIIFPIVLSAAVIWQFSAEIGRQKGDAAAHEQLDFCVRCLSIVNSSWKNAGHYREKLVTGMSPFVASLRLFVLLGSNDANVYVVIGRDKAVVHHSVPCNGQQFSHRQRLKRFAAARDFDGQRVPHICSVESSRRQN